MGMPGAGLLENLGQCTECNGPLCIKSQGLKEQRDGRVVRTQAEVCCESCGRPQVDHPLHRQFAEDLARPEVPREVVVEPLSHQATHADRIKRLEKLVDQQGKQIVELQQREGRSKR